MKKLDPNWFAQGLIDLEHKQYLLLSYLQHIQKEFEKIFLYPALSDLIFHYSNLNQFKEAQDQLRERFPKSLSGLDLEKMKVLFESSDQEEEQIKEIREIVEYAIPLLKGRIEEGKELYEFIDRQIEIDPVGLIPLYKHEGYLLVRKAPEKVIRAYEYQITIFENANETYRGIHTRHVQNYTYSITNSFEHIKQDLIRTEKKLPNPATFAILSEMDFPEQQSLMPVVKRRFVRELGQF